MSRNLALEKVGRARVAYALQLRGWKVGEAYDDGFDLLAYHPETGTTCQIELKAMDTNNRGRDSSLMADVSEKERETSTHIIVYVEPHGWYFIGRTAEIIGEGGRLYAGINADGELRAPRDGSSNFVRFQDCWDELLR